MDDKDRIKELEAEVVKLKSELKEMKSSNSSYRKQYYEKNREKCIKNVQAYKERTGYEWKATSEQKKEANRRYYLKKKAREAEVKKKATENGEDGDIEE